MRLRLRLTFLTIFPSSVSPFHIDTLPLKVDLYLYHLKAKSTIMRHERNSHKDLHHLQHKKKHEVSNKVLRWNSCQSLK